MSDAGVFAILAACAVILGVRGSIRLTRRYRSVRTALDPRERLVLLAFVGVAWTITVAGLYFVSLSVRRILGYPPLEGTASVSVIVASVVLFIPAVIDHVVERVARVPWRG